MCCGLNYFSIQVSMSKLSSRTGSILTENIVKTKDENISANMPLLISLNSQQPYKFVNKSVIHWPTETRTSINCLLCSQPCPHEFCGFGRKKSLFMGPLADTIIFINAV